MPDQTKEAGSRNDMHAKPTFNLDDMSVQELTALRDAVALKHQEKLEQAAAALVKEFTAKASDLGLSLDALLRAPASDHNSHTQTKVKIPIKYRGPNGEKWSGRGRTPKWLSALEATGRTSDEFLVEKQHVR